MAQFHVVAGPDRAPAHPAIRRIDLHDLRGALTEGLDDFMSQPSHLAFLCLIYPVIGLCLAFWASNEDLLPLLYPLISGFALIGPLAAIGLYEISRRREAGLDTSWRHALDVFHSPSLPAIAVLGVSLLVIFLAWLMSAHALYNWLFAPPGQVTLQQFFSNIFNTGQGHSLILLGNAVGFIFAVAVFCISVVSFPLLLDRDIGAGAAVVTSIRSVIENPLPMAVWALIIVAGLALGFVTLFIGLAIVIPVLGHATWHLYRRVVEPAAAG